ncbi:MAG TPA: hypothetical protein VLX92_29905 [Kofleriaceae bacterium]|nr:hypothetical protein [Kofleriaceae bacterium]
MTARLAAIALALAACSRRDDRAGKALVVHLHPGYELAIDHVGAWDLGANPNASDLAPAIDALRSHDAAHVGVLVWGSEDAPRAAELLFHALYDAGFESVRCLRDGSNCR